MTLNANIPIQGERIILRRFRQEDADPMWETIHDPEFSKLTGTHDTFTREQIDNYVTAQKNIEGIDRAAFIIALANDSRAVGEIVINDVERENRSANIRISLFYHEDLGKGYGTEAMRLMVDYGFKYMDLHRISLGVYAFNPSAIHVYEKIGFSKKAPTHFRRCL